MLRTDAYGWRILATLRRRSATTLAATVRQILGGTLLAGKVCRVREQRVYVALALLLAVRLLLAQAVDGFDAVLDGAQSLVDVVAGAQRDACVGASACNGRGFLEGRQR